MRPSHRPDGPGTRRAGGPRAALAFALLALLTLAAAPLSAQAGRIAGRVVNQQTGEPVPGAQVFVTGTQRRVSTDTEGRYSLPNVPAGTVSVTASALGYSAKTVTGVNVAAGAATELNLSLASATLLLDAVTVTAATESGSTQALLTERRRASTVVDAIGAEQIAASPDGDAAAALRRVPGVSVVDGKYVYVRGLGERYGATTLNGAPMPSPLPDRKAVPLDVIPSNLLESVVTSKTYSPDQPGDYAGGLVQIQTRTVPTQRTIRLSTSLGYTAGVREGSAYGFDGGSWDFFGFDDGFRDLPDTEIRNGAVVLPAEGPERDALARAFTRRFAVRDADVPLNQGYSLSFGDEVGVLGRRLGLIASASISNSFSVPEENFERFYNLDAGGTPARDFDFDIAGAQRESSLGTLLSASMEVAPSQRITFSGTYNRLTEDQSRSYTGVYQGASDYVETYLTRYVANSIGNVQLRGEHLVAPLGGLSARWRASYGRASRDEPGTRTVAYRGDGPGQPVAFYSTSSSGLIFSQGLTEDLFSGGLDLRLPLSAGGRDMIVSVGGSADVRDRAVDARRLRLEPVGGGLPQDVAGLTPEELFVPGRIGTGTGQFMIVDRGFTEDNYLAEQRIVAGYGMADVQLLPRLRAVVGARVESARQEVAVANVPAGDTREFPRSVLDDTDVLPALNLSYELSGGMDLRAGVSRTVARPQFRELASFLYADYFGGVPTRGNPNLQRASIVNADLRWEWYFGEGSVVSAGGFYKRFTDPIEQVSLLLGTNPGRSYANSESATLYGAELEFRAGLGALVPLLAPVSVNANVTVTESQVRGDSVRLYNPETPSMPLTYPVFAQDRPLFGQSPYVVNLGLSYFHPRTGTGATLLFNRFGRRLDALGTTGIPDIYEESRSQVDATVEQPLGRGLAVKLSMARLLGGDVRFTQTFPNGEVVDTRAYELGRTFSFSLSWEPGGGR